MTRRALLLGLLILLPRSIGAQERNGLIHPGEILVGSEAERYMRVLQVAGVVELHPWTVRGLSPREVRELYPTTRDHPWSARFESPPEGEGAAARLTLVSPHARASFNSAFPHGPADGAAWSGRGVTGSVEGGFAASWGPLDLSVVPIAFVAQNDAFDLAPTGQVDGVFRDPRAPRTIDLPQRFGTGSLTRVDPGSSFLHLNLPGAILGVSTAPQWFGPAIRHPLILGDNAGGFPHAFLGTAHPVDLWLFRLHGRIMAGRLEQSDFAPPTRTGEDRRVGSAVVVVLVPRGIEGLEIGAASFAHTLWPEDGVGINEVLEPLSLEFAGGRLDEGERDTNHLLSAFFRWTVPDAGIEFYGEFVREDWQPDARDLTLRPEDLSGYMIGLQKVWRRDSGRFVVARGELVNTRWHHLQRGHRGRGDRQPIPLYRHSSVTQGHTHRGQLLVSPAAYGGSGVTLGFDLYEPEGRWTVELERVFLGDRFVATGAGAQDVRYGLGFEAVRFLGDFEVSGRIEPVWELNRHLEEDEDVFNLHLGVGVRYR